MSTSLLLLIIVVAISTWLSRVLPLLVNLEKWVGENNQGYFSQYFKLMGPALIAALLVMSLDKGLFVLSLSTELLSTVAGFSAVIILYVLWRNIGLCVFFGIVIYALTFNIVS